MASRQPLPSQQVAGGALLYIGTGELCAMRLIQGTPNYLTGQSIRQDAFVQQHGAIDDNVVDPDGIPLHPHAATWQVIHRLAGLRCNCVRVEQYEVRDFPRSDETTI